MLDRNSKRRAEKFVLITKADKVFETVKNGAVLEILGRRANQVA